MKLLISNPNRVGECTALIDRQAKNWASSGTDVRTVEPKWGPTELAGEVETLLSAIGVLDRIRDEENDFDAVVLAGFAEPGPEAVRALVGCPVVDITEAGPLHALLLGRTYGILTSTSAAIPTVEDRLRLLGLDTRCTATYAAELSVPDLVYDRRQSLKQVISESERLVADTRCDVVVLGCAGMSGLADEVSAALGLPVIDPLQAAIGLAEQLARTHPQIHEPYSADITVNWPY